MSRLTSNLELLQILSKEIMDNPDLRFSQILINLDFVQVNDYYKEPEDIIKRVKAAKEKYAIKNTQGQSAT